MNLAEYFVQTIKEQKLTYGIFNYKYNKNKQTIKFETGAVVTEITIFDFKNRTVKRGLKKVPMEEVLPFDVELVKSDVKIYINFKGKRVCIMESLQSVDSVKKVMNHLEQKILNTDNASTPALLTPEEQEQLLPINVHKGEEELPFLSARELVLNQETLKKAKERIKDKDFIQSFLTKESGDQTRRIYTRYIPIALIGFLILSLIGWALGNLWIYLSYFFYFLATAFALFFVFRIIIPSIQGADKIYYGEAPNYAQRLGIILPLIDLHFLSSIPKPNNVFTSDIIENIKAGEYDVKFVLSYPTNVDEATAVSEYNQILDWMQNEEKTTYEALRDEINQQNFKGSIQFIISSITGYLPDSSGLDFYRSEIHPYRDNISVYHLEKLTPNRVLLGYSDDDLIFIPYCNEFWQDISK